MLRTLWNGNAGRRVRRVLFELELKQSALSRREASDVLVEQFLLWGFHAHGGLGRELRLTYSFFRVKYTQVFRFWQHLTSG